MNVCCIDVRESFLLAHMGIIIKQYEKQNQTFV